jgi:hypothetical protein
MPRRSDLGIKPYVLAPRSTMFCPGADGSSAADQVPVRPLDRRDAHLDFASVILVFPINRLSICPGDGASDRRGNNTRVVPTRIVGSRFDG